MPETRKTVIIDDPHLTPEQERRRANRVKQMIERGEITLDVTCGVTTIHTERDIVAEILRPTSVTPNTPFG